MTIKTNKFVKKEMYLSSLLLIALVLISANCKTESTKAKTTNEIPTESANQITLSKKDKSNTAITEMPSVYQKNCAECHGNNGEGTKKYPEINNVMTREEDKLSETDLVEILNNPKAYGISSKMPNYRDKLNDEEKQQIAAWIKNLNVK